MRCEGRAAAEPQGTEVIAKIFILHQTQLMPNLTLRSLTGEATSSLPLREVGNGEIILRPISRKTKSNASCVNLEAISSVLGTLDGADERDRYFPYAEREGRKKEKMRNEGRAAAEPQPILNYVQEFLP